MKKGVAAIIAEGKLVPALDFSNRYSFSIESLQGFDVTLGLATPPAHLSVSALFILLDPSRDWLQVRRSASYPANRSDGRDMPLCSELPRSSRPSFLRARQASWSSLLESPTLGREEFRGPMRKARRTLVGNSTVPDREPRDCPARRTGGRPVADFRKTG